jgi:hypothetical protein
MSKELIEFNKRIKNAVLYGTSHPEMYKTVMKEAIAICNQYNLGDDGLVTKLIESQAREIEELKADATERNADHGKLVEENHELRAALVAAVELIERLEGWLNERHLCGLMPQEKEALTRCKEILK